MEKLVKITLIELFFQRFFCHLGPLCGSGDGQKQVGTDGDFVGEKLAHAHQLRPPRRHGVDLGRGNVAWCLGQIAKKSAKK